MRKILFVAIIAIVLVTLYLVFLKNNDSKNIATNVTGDIQNQKNEIDQFHASFLIYTDGLKRNFSNPKYHNQSPTVYLTKENPGTIIVKKANTTWGDFFNTLPMKLEPDCLTTGDGEKLCTNNEKTLKFYINGQKSPNFVYEKINDGDRALISFGNENDLEIQKQIEQIPLPSKDDW